MLQDSAWLRMVHKPRRCGQRIHRRTIAGKESWRCTCLRTLSRERSIRYVSMSPTLLWVRVRRTSICSSNNARYDKICFSLFFSHFLSPVTTMLTIKFTIMVRGDVCRNTSLLHWSLLMYSHGNLVYCCASPHSMSPFFLLDRFVSEFIALTSFASPFLCCIFIFLTFVIVYFVARHVYLGYFVARHVSLLYFVVRHGNPFTLFMHITVLS